MEIGGADHCDEASNCIVTPYFALVSILSHIPSADGKEITLSPPTGDELPAKGFDPGSDTYQGPPSAAQRAALSVKVRMG